MPDFIVQAYWHCSTAEWWRTQVPSSNGRDVYTVTWGPDRTGNVEYDWSCTCKRFQFYHTCKHIDSVKSQRCGWDQFEHGGDRTPEGKCPKCNGEVGAHNVGV